MLVLYKGKFFPRQGKKEKLYLNYLKKSSAKESLNVRYFYFRKDNFLGSSYFWSMILKMDFQFTTFKRGRLEKLYKDAVRKE